MNPVRIYEGAGPFTTELLLWYSSWGEGGSTSIWQKKTSDSVVWLFFAFFLVLGLFYRSQMVNFKEKYHFSSWFRRVSKFFQGGGGGWSNCLLPIETQITCDFPGGSGPPVPSPLDSHLAAIYLVSQSSKWCDRLLACTCARFPATSLFNQAPQ